MTLTDRGEWGIIQMRNKRGDSTMQAYAAYYENGRIIPIGNPPIPEKRKLVITVLDEEVETSKKPLRYGRGCMKGKMWLADDFDAPLEDFKEYMHV